MKKITIAPLILILAMLLLSACSKELQEGISNEAEVIKPFSAEESLENNMTIKEPEHIKEATKNKTDDNTESSDVLAKESTEVTTPTKVEQSPQANTSANPEAEASIDIPSEQPQNASPPAESQSVTSPEPQVIAVGDSSSEPEYDSSAEYNAAIAYLREKGCEITNDDGHKIQFWYGSCNCRIYDHTIDGIWDFSGGDSVVNEPFWYTCEKGELLETIKIVVQ